MINPLRLTNAMQQFLSLKKTSSSLEKEHTRLYHYRHRPHYHYYNIIIVTIDIIIISKIWTGISEKR